MIPFYFQSTVTVISSQAITRTPKRVIFVENTLLKNSIIA
jgi:hypothetical protein